MSCSDHVGAPFVPQNLLPHVKWWHAQARFKMSKRYAAAHPDEAHVHAVIDEFHRVFLRYARSGFVAQIRRSKPGKASRVEEIDLSGGQPVNTADDLQLPGLLCLLNNRRLHNQIGHAVTNVLRDRRVQQVCRFAFDLVHRGQHRRHAPALRSHG